MFSVQEQEERDYNPQSAFQNDMEETRMFGDPERAWLLSDFDVWVKNPRYHGPEVPHPEYEGEDDDFPDMPDSVFFRVDPIVEDLVRVNVSRENRGLPPIYERY